MKSVERHTFRKNERLCRTKLINEIFEAGNVFNTSQFKVAWNISSIELPFPAQVAFSVPKKNFKLAVTRNLIKRRMREAYRIKKHLLYNFLVAENIQIILVLIYRHTVVHDYQVIEKSVIELIEKLCAKIRHYKKNC